MTTVVIIVGVLLYAGPCALFYMLGKQNGYAQGLVAGSTNVKSNPCLGWTPKI